MDQHSEYLIQLLEKIGVPLMVAITEVSDSGEEPSAESPDELAGQDAQKIAELLARAVQVSIDIGKNMDLAAAVDQGESVRVALAALSGPMVAGYYKQNRRIPADQDLKRIVTALQAVMTFSENFVPSPENTQRLEQIKAQGVPVDAMQVNIQYIQAFLPAVNAIGVFPFGRPEKKLMQDVSDRLVKEATRLRESVFGTSLPSDDQKFTELALLRSLACIYAECHRAETSRLMAMDEVARTKQAESEGGALSLEPVWTAFDLRASMLEALGLGLGPGAQGASGQTEKEPVAPEAPAETPPPVKEQTLPPAQEQAATEPSPPPIAAEPPPSEKQESPPAQESSGPMSFFKPPKSSEE